MKRTYSPDLCLSHFKMTGSEGEREKLPETAPLRLHILILGVVSMVLGWFSYEIYLPHTAYSGEKAVEISPGLGSRSIGELLEENGFIQSKWAFVTYATLNNKASSLKPGVYVFSEESTIAEILEQLVKGEEFPNERFLVIPEGWSLRDIGSYLERNGITQAEEFREIAGFPALDYRVADVSVAPKDFSNEFAFLREKSNAVGLEGYLFPDTYRVYRDASLEDIARKMLANFDKRFTADMRRAAALRKRTVFEVVTMASLIEKEVVNEDDRRVVSGILWKRLERGIPLQVDATLVYIRGHNDTPLTSADKALNSRFNTYRYLGLPLGPIANPGLSAIQAALNPKESSYLYYLSARDGRTIFSKTLEEHNEAKAEYLR